MLTKNSLTTLGLAVALASGLVNTALAQSSGGQSGQPPSGGPSGPPPEAIAACVGKTEGTTVSFTGRGGETFTGICQKDGNQLAARPAGAPK